MTKDQVNTGLQSADAVVQAFADASAEFDATIFKAYLDAYPKYDDRLKSYVQVWLMSSRASGVEIAEQDIPLDHMLKAQSRLLMVWEQGLGSVETLDAAEAARRLGKFEGDVGLKTLTKTLLGSEDEDEDVLVMEYLDPGLRDEPNWVRRRLGGQLRCRAEIVPQALLIHRAQQQAHFSAQGKPEVAQMRTWREAVSALDVSAERKRDLLKEEE